VDEARAAGLLNHPNPLIAYYVGTHDSSAYNVNAREGDYLTDLK
jgi:hypothetical protein